MLKFIRSLFGNEPSESGNGSRDHAAAAPLAPLRPGARILSFESLEVEPGRLHLLDGSRLQAISLAPQGTGGPPAGGWASILLRGSLALPFQMSRGDLVTGSPEGSFVSDAEGALLLVDSVPASPDAPRNPRRIACDDLVGSGIRGISGIRIIHRSQERAVLRLGPPPGARWAVSGMRGLALFSGKMLLFDGGEPRMVGANSLVILDNPGATLYLQAGNDSAVALAFAETGVSVALG